jgi:flagella basal body P-ring formation protein FlgA
VLKFFVLSLTIMTSLWAKADKLEVRIADMSTVRTGDPIRLGTISSGLEKDPILYRRIYDTVVYEPIDSESTQTFTSESLAIILRNKLSMQDLQQVSFKIPESFALKARRNFIYPQDIQHSIVLQAENTCKPCDVIIDDLRIPVVKTQNEILSVNLDTTNLKGAGGFLLPLNMETSQGKNSVWVTGRLSIYKMAPVAKRLIQMNERLTESDFEFKRVNINFTRDGIPAAAELVGKMASHPIGYGQTIFYADLKNELAARRGEIVKLILGDKEFEVSSQGTAEEQGSIGDIIRVKVSDSQKMMSGILVDKGVVRIQ